MALLGGVDERGGIFRNNNVSFPEVTNKVTQASDYAAVFVEFEVQQVIMRVLRREFEQFANSPYKNFYLNLYPGYSLPMPFKRKMKT